ncbi:MAG: S26 family signal peptidase, partial [Elusimicrobiota bacterium]
MNRENLPVTQSKIFRTVFEWVETLWSAVLLAAVIMFFVIQAFKIPSGSMIKTLLIGDHLF